MKKDCTFMEMVIKRCNWVQIALIKKLSLNILALYNSLIFFCVDESYLREMKTIFQQMNVWRSSLFYSALERHLRCNYRYWTLPSYNCRLFHLSESIGGMNTCKFMIVMHFSQWLTHVITFYKKKFSRNFNRDSNPLRAIMCNLGHKF